jgi:hypothetical protein
VYLNWLPVAISLTSYCDKYCPHLQVMSSRLAVGFSTPHKPESSSDRAHFAAVTAVLKPLQPGRHALVVGEGLGSTARVAGEQQCEQGAGANTKERHSKQYRGQNEAGRFLAEVAERALHQREAQCNVAQRRTDFHLTCAGRLPSQLYSVHP